MSPLNTQERFPLVNCHFLHTPLDEDREHPLVKEKLPLQYSTQNFLQESSKTLDFLGGALMQEIQEWAGIV